MDEEKKERAETLALLRQIQADTAAQARYARRQSRMAAVCAGCCGAVLALALGLSAVFVPKLNRTMAQVDTILQDMESVSAELDRSLPGLMADLDALASTSAQGISQALEKIAALDIDTMNEAIADLHSVVEPLARLFGR